MRHVFELLTDNTGRNIQILDLFFLKLKRKGLVQINVLPMTVFFFVLIFSVYVSPWDIIYFFFTNNDMLPFLNAGIHDSLHK